MGYNFTVGNAQICYDKNDLSLRLVCASANHPDAPAHDKYVGTGNMRSPSYIAWTNFCKEAGIFELFYGQGWDRDERCYLECTEEFHRETPLRADHPGIQPICEGDLQYIRAALQRRKDTNGGRQPGFWDDGIDNGTDPTLARLLWLEFWFDWALKNCEYPAIQNT